MQKGGQAESGKEIDAHELVPRLRSMSAERSIEDLMSSYGCNGDSCSCGLLVPPIVLQAVS